MDFNRFDDLSRALGSVPSRRGVLVGLTSALFATLPLALSNDAAARKRKKKGKKNRKKDKPSPPPPPPPDCTPQCDGRICGDDGCGGTCGECSTNEICDSGTCVCVPACAPANACGADGCGGSCGACAVNQTCTGTQLTRHECRGGVCTPVTTSCGAGQRCFQNACCKPTVPPRCRKQAIPDGCGGTHPANCTGFCCEGPGGGELICQATPCP